MADPAGQAAPAASPRTNLAASVVVRPDATPVEKIHALLNTERPVQPGERLVQQPPAPLPVQAEATKPAEAPAPQEAPAEAPADAPAEAPQTPDTPAEQNTQVEGKDATREIPLDELLSVALETTVKGDDGNDVVEKPTVKELREGYMRQKDYSRKTADVARQREAIPEEIRKGVEGAQAAYYQTLQVLQDTVMSSMDAELKDVNWNALAKDDPATYVLLDNRRKQLERTLGEITAKQQAHIAERKAEHARTQDEKARKSWDVLQSKIPGWDATKYQSLMKAAAENYGYKPEEVGQWVDHRAFEILHDAMQFRAAKAAKPAEVPLKDKRVVVVPKSPAPGAKTQVTQSQAKESQAMENLRKRGTTEAAADVIRSRLG